MAFIITNFHKSEKEIYKEAIKRCPISDLHIRDEAFKLDDGITPMPDHCALITYTSPHNNTTAWLINFMKILDEVRIEFNNKKKISIIKNP